MAKNRKFRFRIFYENYFELHVFKIIFLVINTKSDLFWINTASFYMIWNFFCNKIIEEWYGAILGVSGILLKIR